MDIRVIRCEPGNSLGGFFFAERGDGDVRPLGLLELLSTKEGEIAVEAAARAGALLRRAYKGTTHGEKEGVGDRGVKATCDAEGAILRHLREATPNIPIISKNDRIEMVLPSGKAWVIDPLNGTESFIYRTDPAHPSIMITLLDRGMPVSSTIYLPLVDRWFCAEKGRGAWIFESDEDGVAIASRVRSDDGPTTLRDAHVVMCHFGEASLETGMFKAMSRIVRGARGAGLVTVDPPNMAVSCRMMDQRGRIGAVAIDNSPNMERHGFWDIAPILLFVEEAGGYVCDSFGNPYSPGTGAPIVITRNRHIHAELFGLMTNDGRVIPIGA